MAKQQTVTIYYKSGNQITVTCKEFSVTKQNGEFKSIKWDSISPKPLYINPEEIESIWHHNE